MRIAISGTHYSGKSTLVQALGKEMPGYEIYDEPYWALTELGRQFSDPPTIEEFEEQLDYSIALIKESANNSLFDRCPIDFLAYALAIAEMDCIEFDSETWELKIAKVLPSIDLLVFLPLENPDRIPVPASEDSLFRELADEKLRELILDNSRQMMTTKVLEATGILNERVKKIKQQQAPI
ncbi:MAG: AAA family ATPase [Verrucomicrobia bacterium]|nr:AAA family ATPase [Verrucomicrobiota bacterium]